jgi:hypothetical protein
MAQIILDSGAYTAWTKGVKIDLDEYIQFIKDHSDIFDVYINLDVIGDPEGSFQNWKYMKKAGLDPLPVYHNGAPIHYLEAYMEACDYIGFGAIAIRHTTQRVMGLRHIWDKYLLDEQGNPKRKMHGLGLTAIDIMTLFPWYSVDSASCVLSASFGKIFLPVRGNFKNLILPTVSDQGRHDAATKTGTFFKLPKLIQKESEQLIEEMGFKLGTINNIKKRPRRCDKGAEQIEQAALLYNDMDSLEEEATLCNNYIERYKFNIAIWEMVGKAQTPNNVNIYQVCSTTVHTKIVSNICKEPKILVSYLVTKKAMLELLYKLKNKEVGE